MWVFPTRKVDEERMWQLWSNLALPPSIVIPKLRGKDWLLAKVKAKLLASYLTKSCMLNLAWPWSGRLSHSHKLINKGWVWDALISFNLFSFLLLFDTILGFYCIFGYYSWVSLYYSANFLPFFFYFYFLLFYTFNKKIFNFS